MNKKQRQMMLMLKNPCTLMQSEKRIFKTF